MIPVPNTGVIAGPRLLAAGTSTFWRVFALGADSDLVSIAKMEIATSTGGADRCTGGTVLGNMTEGFKAFDSDPDTYATSASIYGVALGYQFSTPIQPVELRLTARNAFGSSGFWVQCPRAFVLQVSYDAGATWVTTDWIVTTAWTEGQQKAFAVTGLPLDVSAGRAVARAWRMNATVNAAGGTTGSMRCGEFILAASGGGSTLCTNGADGAPMGEWAAIAATEAADRLTDGTSATGHVTNAATSAPYRFGYAFAVPTDPVELRVQAPTTGFAPDLNQMPRDWTIQWTANGVDWTTTDTITGQTGWSSAEVRAFSIS